MIWILLFICILLLATLFALIMFEQKINMNRVKKQAPFIRQVIVAAPPSSPFSEETLESIFRNRDIQNNVPQGGFLATMFNIEVIGCDPDKVPDLSDVRYIIETINPKVDMTRYSLDLTYLRDDLPRYVFGPTFSFRKTETPVSKSWQIGLLLDATKLFPYIACMYTIDSGSVARVGATSNYAKQINDQDLTTEYPRLLNSKKGLGLNQAGCGLIQHDVRDRDNPASFMITSHQQIPPTPTERDIRRGWAFTQKPWSRNLWREWLNSIKAVQKPIDRIGSLFFKLQFFGVDGYRENEVDLFVPDDLERFAQIWRDSILGVFTNDLCAVDVWRALKQPKLDPNNKDCCGPALNRRLVRALVDRINRNAPNKIGGYVIKTTNPLD